LIKLLPIIFTERIETIILSEYVIGEMYHENLPAILEPISIKNVFLELYEKKSSFRSCAEYFGDNINSNLLAIEFIQEFLIEPIKVLVIGETEETKIKYFCDNGEFHKLSFCYCPHRFFHKRQKKSNIIFYNMCGKCFKCLRYSKTMDELKIPYKKLINELIYSDDEYLEENSCEECDGQDLSFIEVDMLFNYFFPNLNSRLKNCSCSIFAKNEFIHISFPTGGWIFYAYSFSHIPNSFKKYLSGFDLRNTYFSKFNFFLTIANFCWLVNFVKFLFNDHYRHCTVEKIETLIFQFRGDSFWNFIKGDVTCEDVQFMHEYTKKKEKIYSKKVSKRIQYDHQDINDTKNWIKILKKNCIKVVIDSSKNFNEIKLIQLNAGKENFKKMKNSNTNLEEFPKMNVKNCDKCGILKASEKYFKIHQKHALGTTHKYFCKFSYCDQCFISTYYGKQLKNRHQFACEKNSDIPHKIHALENKNEDKFVSEITLSLEKMNKKEKKSQIIPVLIKGNCVTIAF
jgi:hypothetical protein